MITLHLIVLAACVVNAVLALVAGRAEDVLQWLLLATLVADRSAAEAKKRAWRRARRKLDMDLETVVRRGHQVGARRDLN